MRSISQSLEYAVSVVCNRLKSRLENIDWRYRKEQFFWHELVACILGSQVQHEQAQAAVNHLKIRGLLDVRNLCRNKRIFSENIRKALDQPIFPPFTESGGRKYRYPNLRAEHIYRTAKSIYLNGYSIKRILGTCRDEYEARLKIMSVSVGIGPKQASLFLRNICYADNLAILDMHVLRYMSIVGLLPSDIQVIASLNKYINTEGILLSYAERFREKLAYLDTAIWIVMRTYRGNVG